MESLPYERLLDIISHLPTADVVNFCQTNREYSGVCNDMVFWSHMAQDRLKFPVKKFRDLLTSYPSLFNTAVNLYSYIEGLILNVNDNFSSSIDKDDPLAVSVLIEYIHFDEQNIRQIIKVLSRKPNVSKILLADYRIDPALRNNQALIDAVFYNEIGQVRTLLKDPRVNPADRDNEAIKIACGYGKQSETVRLLLKDPRVDPSINNNYPIILATENDNIDTVRLLLRDPRVNPAANNNQALKNAAESGNGHMLYTLLDDHRIDPSVNNNEVLSLAATNSSDALSVILEDPRVNPSDNNNQALKLAIEYGHLDSVSLLENDPRINLSPDEKTEILQMLTDKFRSVYNMIINI